MRYLCGVVVLLVLWPIALMFDLVMFCAGVGILAIMAWDIVGGGPWGTRAAMRATELLFERHTGS